MSLRPWLRGRHGSGRLAWSSWRRVVAVGRHPGGGAGGAGDGPVRSSAPTAGAGRGRSRSGGGRRRQRRILSSEKREREQAAYPHCCFIEVLWISTSYLYISAVRQWSSYNCYASKYTVPASAVLETLIQVMLALTAVTQTVIPHSQGVTDLKRVVIPIISLPA